MDEILSPKEIRKILKCSLPLVYKMADRGQLACVRWDCAGTGERKKTTVRFELEAIRFFIEHDRQDGEALK